jgi:chloride channel protein, CIC family
MTSRKAALRTILFPLLLAVVIGALAGLGAVFFRWLIEIGINLFWAGEGGFVSQYQDAPVLWRVGIPVLAGFILGPLLHYVAPEIRGPGVPEVMAALAQRDGIIRHRVTLAKSFATATFIASGCSLGREGPIVQIGASIGSSLCQFFRLGPDHRKLAVACGAAAGIAATFQAPMAGTLFVVEILLFDLEVTSLSHIVIAAVTGTVVSRSFWADGILFQAPQFVLGHPAELLLYLGLGLMAGLLSLLLMALIFGLTKGLDQLGVPGWLSPALGGLFIGILGLFHPQALGVGYEAVIQVLQGDFLFSTALILLLAKLLATSSCIGSGMSGGIFAPSLFLGAMLGAMCGNLALLIWPTSPMLPSHFALVGMGAMVAGTTLAPITAILTIFELSYNYEIILPLMLACIPSIIVVRLLHGFSIYETKLLMQGIRIVRGHDANRLRTLKIHNYICTDHTILSSQTPLTEVLDKILNSSFPHFMVNDEQGKLVGIVTLRDVRAFLNRPEPIDSSLTAADLMTREMATVNENDNLEAAFHLFSNHHFSFLPVMSLSNPEQAVGCLKKDDLITAYNQHILKDHCHPASNLVCHLPEKK